MSELDEVKAENVQLCARVAELGTLLDIAVEKLESFKETGGVWNDGDEPTLALLHKAAKGGTP